MSASTPVTDTNRRDEHEQVVDLAIGGMTCASCSARIERKLNRLDGVTAGVNLATEKAHVQFHAPLTADDLIATVEQTGYTATVLGANGRAGAPEGSTRPAAREAPPSTPQRESAAAAESSRPATESADLTLSGTPAPTSWRDRADTWLRGPGMPLRAAVAAALTLPLVLIAMVSPIGELFGGARPWVELVLALPVVVWAAYPFHRAAWINARHGASTMDTLVSLGVSAAFLWSFVATLAGSTGHLYYETAAVITTFLLLGRTAEARARHRGKAAVQSLLELGATQVTLLETAADGTTTQRRADIDELGVGDRFVVRPGEKVAADGVVVEGRSSIDRSLVTGESVPVEVEVGDEVTGGTINTTGRLVVEATRVGADTTLAGITRLVEAAQTGKAPVQRLADRVSAVFVPVVLAITVVTFLAWLLTGNPVTAALSAAVSVLVIACPCALGLATPTALLAGTGRGAEMGVLIKGPEILENTRRADVVVLDKTGTITTGTMRLVHIATAGRLTSTAALEAAAAVESGSEHPVAGAIVAAATERGLTLRPIEEFVSLPGSGARADIRGTTVTVGRADLFDVVPEEIATPDSVGTTVYVGWGGAARAALTVADEVRPTSAAAIARLRALGLTPYLLTGDNLATAQAVATTVGIDPEHVLADVRPQDKHTVVTRLQGEGHSVAMIGDGVNDAAALAAADLGIAMGSGTDVAMESADIVLMRPDLDAAADAIELSRRTLSIIKQNLGWAFGYNVAAIPLAAFGLLNPMIAGAAMALSSVLVVANSLRLRSFGRTTG